MKILKKHPNYLIGKESAKTIFTKLVSGFKHNATGNLKPDMRAYTIPNIYLLLRVSPDIFKTGLFPCEFE